MSGAVVTAAWMIMAASVGAEPAFCVRPADCGEGGVCVAGLCREGSERARIERLHPVAVPDALAVGDAPWLRREAERLTRQLRRDLAWTGFYDVLAEGELPAGWRAEGVSPAETRRGVWQAAGAYRVLKASLAPADGPGAYRLRIRLVEVERYGVIDLEEGARIVRPGGTRRASADWVDALVAHDTGLPSAVGARLVASVHVGRGVKEIAVMDPDGGALSWVTGNGSLNLNPAWGPGGRVGYMSYASGNADWVVDGTPRSTRPGLNAAGAWSPDGRWLALSLAEAENSDVVLLESETGREYARLTTDPGVDTSPAWSPDGRRIAFTSDRTGSPQVWIVSLDDGKLTRLSRGGYETSPAWSPLGETIFYAKQMGAGRFAIMRRDLDTGRTTRLTPPGMSAEAPAVSPDGRMVAFVHKEGADRPRLWIMRADGSHARPLGAPDRPTFSPDWQPR